MNTLPPSSVTHSIHHLPAYRLNGRHHGCGIGQCILAGAFGSQVRHRQNRLGESGPYALDQLLVTGHGHHRLDLRAPGMGQGLPAAPHNTRHHTELIADPGQVPDTALSAAPAFVKTVQHIAGTALPVETMRQQQQHGFGPHLDPAPPYPGIIDPYDGLSKHRIPPNSPPVYPAGDESFRVRRHKAAGTPPFPLQLRSGIVY